MNATETRPTTTEDEIAKACDAVAESIPEAAAILIKGLRSEDPAVAVQAAQGVFLASQQLQATYVFDGSLNNSTPHTLVLDAEGSATDLDPAPPAVLAPGGTATWTGRKNGFRYKGTVKYAVEDHPEWCVVCSWKIPLMGKNTIAIDTTIPDTSVRYEGGRGWKSFAWYYLAEGAA